MIELLEKLLEDKFEDIFQPLSDEEVKDRGLQDQKKVVILLKKLEELPYNFVWRSDIASHKNRWQIYPSPGSTMRAVKNGLYSRITGDEIKDEILRVIDEDGVFMVLEIDVEESSYDVEIFLVIELKETSEGD